MHEDAYLDMQYEDTHGDPIGYLGEDEDEYTDDDDLNDATDEDMSARGFHVDSDDDLAASALVRNEAAAIRAQWDMDDDPWNDDGNYPIRPIGR